MQTRAQPCNATHHCRNQHWLHLPLQCIALTRSPRPFPIFLFHSSLSPTARKFQNYAQLSFQLLGIKLTLQDTVVQHKADGRSRWWVHDRRYSVTVNCGVFYATLEIVLKTLTNSHSTRMWTNAQRDGCPAEYRWRPLFDAAVWLTPTTRVPCSNAAKMRNPLKVAGVHKLTKRSQPLVGRSSRYCKDMWGDIAKFFSDCRYVP